MSSSAHVHVEPSGALLAEAGRTALEEQGEQWTPLRAAVFDLLAEADRPLSAYDLADHLSRNREKRVAPNSVYRILDLFVSSNLALRIECANAYIVNAHPGCRHDCIFMVCRNCGGATHVDNDALTQQVRAVATRNDFTADRPIIEIQGVCAACRDAERIQPQ